VRRSPSSILDFRKIFEIRCARAGGGGSCGRCQRNPTSTADLIPVVRDDDEFVGVRCIARMHSGGVLSNGAARLAMARAQRDGSKRGFEAVNAGEPVGHAVMQATSPTA